MSIHVHNQERLTELRQQIASDPLVSSGRHTKSSAMGSNSEFGLTSNRRPSHISRETQKKRTAMKHELYEKEREAYEQKLSESIAENLAKQRARKDAQFAKLVGEVESAKSLAGDLKEKLSVHEDFKTKNFERMHEEWNANVFDKLNEPVRRKVREMDSKALCTTKHESYQRYLDTANKKKLGLFRDIIIENEYSPLEDTQYIRYSTPLDDPVKQVLREREDEEAFTLECNGGQVSNSSLGRHDNLDVKLWSKGVFESTPHGYFHKMMNSQSSAGSSTTYASHIPMEHYAIAMGKDVVLSEMPRGKRTSFGESITIPKTTIHLQ